ncbi:alpha/beta hydrolase [Nocardiopsis oceani]
MLRARITVRTAAVATAAGLALSLTAALPAAADPVDENALAPFHDQEVVWGECEEDLLEDLECAEVEVPLDYADPEGERLTLGISRAAATDPEAHRGILLLNAGGPGGPSRYMADAYSQTPLGAAYDLIGMDPRGSGASSALDCDVEYPLISPRPDEAEIAANTRETIHYSRACDEAEGDRLPHMTTANTARDMDVIRATQGEEQTNYLGYSYGTYLGAVYGSLFPERLDRSVLDSPIHPDRVWRDVFLMQAPGHSANVERYTEWLAEHDEVYGLGTTPDEIVANFDETSARLTEEPREDVPGVPEFDGALFDMMVGEGARDQGDWDETSWVVQALVTGEPVPELDGGAGIPDDLLELTEMNFDLFSAVVCEAEWPDRISEYHADTREQRDEHPFGVGALWATPQTCAFTDNQPTEPPVEVEHGGSTEPLVIAGEFDPQTPYEGAPVMADRLGAPLVTVTDDGAHGFYGMGDEEGLLYPCVDDLVHSYLLDGTVPEDTECPGVPRPEGTPEPPGEVVALGDGWMPYDEMERTSPLPGLRD